MTYKLPLLLIPGLVSTRLLWESQVNDLSDIADCWIAPIPPYDDFRTMAREILANAPERFAMAGHSMGGYLCFEILRLAPQRVLGLGLFSTTVERDTPQISRRRAAMMADVKTKGYLPMIRENAPRFVVDNSRGKQVVEMMVKQAFEVGQSAFCMHQSAAIRRTGYDDVPGRIDCPTLVLAGKQDKITRTSVQRRIAKQIPGAEFHAIDGSAHMFTMEKSEETNRLMRRWLIGQELALAA